MINISIDVMNGRMNVSGHSGFANRGHDIVCAGVSSISFALISYACKHHNESIQSINIDDGIANIVMMTDRTGYEEAFEMARIGFELIKDKYPEFVSVEVIS